jgi:hypothetical protein
LKNLLIFAALGYALLANAAAVAEPQRYGVLGDGNTSCGTCTRDRTGGAVFDRASANFHLAWVLGFLSGMNYHHATRQKVGNITRGTDIDGLFAWIDNYCKQHPLDTIANATEALYGALLEKEP